jgi:lantibiotic biosynthesis protein
VHPAPLDTGGGAGWQRLLAGEAEAAAVAAIDEIADALDAHPPAGASLLDGHAGRALFYAYLDQARPGQGHDARAAQHLERAADAMAETEMHDGLYGGVTGVAWVAHHLQGGTGEGDEDDANGDIDGLLCDHVAREPWPGDYDVISGLAGLAIYGLERMPGVRAGELVSQVVQQLGKAAIATDDGVCWHRAAGFMGPTARVDAPDGSYDLGVAHGVPGVLAVLAGAVAAGVAPAIATPLLDGAWRWMTAHRLPPDAATAYGYAFPSRPGVVTRSAWCYGDPGVAAAMHAAARHVGNAGWIDEAMALALRAAARPIEQCGCVDAGLCHGTAGLALIYQRLWHASGEATLADAARRWVDETLARRRSGVGLAGFQSHVVGGDAAEADDASFLTGVVGIGLALIAATSEVEPAWDRLLALSLRGP